MRAPVTLRSQPLSTKLTTVATMARGRAARKAPRRTNPTTPPRPRRRATLRFCPRVPCRAPISGAACAISPGNPSLRRSSRPSSPPAPPRMSSGRRRCAGRISAFSCNRMTPFGSLTSKVPSWAKEQNPAPARARALRSMRACRGLAACVRRCARARGAARSRVLPFR